MTNVKFTPPRGAIGLEAEVTVIVPSTEGVREQRKITVAEMNKRIKDVEYYLSKLFGGYTNIKALGGYALKKKGEVVHEDVAMVTSFGDKNIAISKQKEFNNRVQYWCKLWQQETVGIIWEGDFYMIKRK